MITIDLGGSIVTYALFIVLGILGFSRGFRYMVSIAVFMTIGYMITVAGGEFIVGFVNRVYGSWPKLLTLITGGNPANVDPLPPIIPANVQAPLLLRMLVFLALTAIGIGYAWPWEGKAPLSGFQGNRQMRILGMLTGLYIGVLGVSALASFWQQAFGLVRLPSLVEIALGSLPNLGSIVPAVIAAFGILIAVIIVLRFDRIWKT